MDKASIHTIADTYVEMRTHNLSRDLTKLEAQEPDDQVELLALSFFFDAALFAQHFEQKVALYFVNYIVPNVILALSKEKIISEQFDFKLCKKRMVEYWHHLPTFLSDIKVGRPSALSAVYSQNICGYKDPVLMGKADIIFLMMLKNYGKFISDSKRVLKINRSGEHM
ncbi:MAG: hypothetical protein Q8P99_00785 [bacterium]|nr:hypothetical protein [bacterium]